MNARIALGNAMPHVRDNIAYYANRRVAARLATPAAVEAARGVFVDAYGLLASTATVYRRIVTSITAIGVLASRKTLISKDRDTYFRLKVKEFLNDYQKLDREKRKVGKFVWTRRSLKFVPELGELSADLRDLVHDREMYEIRVVDGEKSVSVQVDVGHGHVVDPHDDDMHWLATINTRVGSDGTTTAHADVYNGCEVYGIDGESIREANNRDTSCVIAAFFGVRLFGPGIRIDVSDEVNAVSAPLSWELKGLRNAISK